ncbi:MULTISPECIES: SRPBCC family protein [unclassified Nocardioides]|uniref:SRPBCC family protein n=1 Tax=unclassified Nocardioides TaxID=2615069 RepID=UPI00138F0D07|nr:MULTISPECIES: SRPBCC family protein [unclassified Nocardioides]
MSNVVEHSVEIAAPVSKVFAYVDDFSTTKDWMYGLKKIEPVTEQVHGVGAQYDGVMKLGVALKSRIECTGWEQDRLLELTSIKGIQTTQRWTFTAVGADRTRLEAWISFTLPGGPAGKAIESAVKPVVGVAVKHTAAALVKNVEAL